MLRTKGKGSEEQESAFPEENYNVLENTLT